MGLDDLYLTIIKHYREAVLPVMGINDRIFRNIPKRCIKGRIAMDKAWKRAERQVGQFFGAHRTPLSGGNGRITRSDTLHPSLFIETKYFSTDRFNAVESLYNVTAEMAKREHKTPIVCLKRARKTGFLMVLRECDLLDVAMMVAENQQKDKNQEEEKCQK
jgi:hypothetical protein